MSLTSILTGGFLAGYRTYIVGTLLVIKSLAAYLTGDSTLMQFLQSPDLVAGLTGLGLMTLRAGVSK